MIDGFAFENEGRRFTCTPELTRKSPPEGWWWFSLESDLQGQRYAPFRVAATDTRRNVEERIVAYYDDMLARRAAPPTPYYRGRRPGAPAPATETTAEHAVPAPSTEDAPAA